MINQQFEQFRQEKIQQLNNTYIITLLENVHRYSVRGGKKIEKEGEIKRVCERERKREREKERERERERQRKKENVVEITVFCLGFVHHATSITKKI